MNANRKSLFIRSSGPNQEAVRRGIAWLAKATAANSQSSRAALAVCTKGNLSGTVIEEVIGAAACKSLAKGSPVRLGSAELQLITLRDRLYTWQGPVLAVFPDKKLLDKIDGLSGVTDLLVIPWTMEESDFWIKAWSAAELDAPQQSSTPAYSLDPVLEGALRSLTERVNLSTGITHPSDKAATIDMFHILRAHRIPYTPEAIRAWLVGKGNWNPQDADAVRDVAQGILDGRRLRGGSGPSWNDRIIEVWRERASRSGQGTKP